MTGHQVSRWHASPVEALRLSGDTIEAHQSRCADLIRDLWPDAPETLIQAALHHDEPEKWLGDMPFTTKRDFPQLAREYRKAELLVIKQHNIPQPATAWDEYQVKLVDLLDAYMWMLKHAPACEFEPDWVAAWSDIMQRAETLGVAGKVRYVIAAVR